MEKGTGRAVARHLLQIKAIKLSPQKPFIWASGLKSPIYCDNRISLSYPAVRRFLKDQLVQACRSLLPFDRIAGVATAGIPHGMLLADVLDLPFLYIRNKPKAHGRGNQIEGEIAVGASILLVEDLISTGGSSLAAVRAVREAGMEVSGVLAIFSYGFGVAQEAFAKENCPLRSLSDFPTLLEEAKAGGEILPQDAELLAKWSADPEKWSRVFDENSLG